MTRPIAAASNLQERFDGFGNGYRMNCNCGRATNLSAATYVERETIDALIPCDHCDRTIHFGPAVAAIRDEHDPALDNAVVPRLAWYHTSTSPDWPSATYAAQVESQMKEATVRLAYPFERFVERETTKALHVGTYEAAIENMLRRMHDQADATSQFYLHRVTLDLDPSRINDGYRDENHEPASHLSISDLEAAGLDAVRYLNVHEAVGSLSLAVHPRALRTVQTLALPVADVAGSIPPLLGGQLAELNAQRQELASTAKAWTHVDSRQLRRMQLGLSVDPDDLGQRSQEVEQRTWQLWNTVNELLEEHYLPGLSPVIRRDFSDALRLWRTDSGTDSVTDFAEFYAASAIVMTKAREVVRLVSEKEPRQVILPLS
jgi:hypothetical protein